MMKTLQVFLNPQDEYSSSHNLREFRSSAAVCEVNMLDAALSQTTTLRLIEEKCKEEYLLLYTKNAPLALGQFALERMLKAALDSGASMVYADHYKEKEGKLQGHPLNDYQLGSIRDDFDFGSLLLIKSDAFKQAVAEMNVEYSWAGLYDLRLKLALKGELVHLNEFLYTEQELDNRKSGEKQFDYVDPKNRKVQIEMEEACTDYLRKTGAFLEPEFEKIEFAKDGFPLEASVIIPVRNRVKTINDAILSVLKQKTDFNFNCIIIDNHSTDGTSEIIKEFAANDQRVIHIVPGRMDLGIGGCWNEGIFSVQCGKFAVQLDSDDVYSDENTLSTIVKAFYEQNCAMVIGSYTMTNFQMETIAPGLIDHKEWTPDNGRNNALRINGLGAPRAFYTPVLREIRVPNTSYGEDYALGLAISRNYQIGRIYNSLYLCRRWDDNSDASLDIVKLNAHNAYKDKLRTLEIRARILKNA